MSEQAATILVVDDEVNLAKGIKENLEIEGHSVEAVFHGRTALERVRASTYDLVILDVMLPGVDGFTLCKTMRDEGQTTPVLFLTAKGEATDRIRGLEAGGDDYLPKPFHLRELLLRVHAILRRSRWYDAALDRESEVRFDGNEFDFRSFKGRSWDGKEHTIPHKEAMIFKVLAERTGEVVSREDNFPPPEPSTTSSSACANGSSPIPSRPGSFTPCVVLDIGSPQRQTKSRGETLGAKHASPLQVCFAPTRY
jgi:two-component system alkaline phosphatase synthesis response regulator PhoP